MSANPGCGSCQGYGSGGDGWSPCPRCYRRNNSPEPSVPEWWPEVAQSSDVALNDQLVRDAANADVSAPRLIVMMAGRHREVAKQLAEAPKFAKGGKS